MRTFARCIAVFLLLVLLSACTNAPEPAGLPASVQTEADPIKPTVQAPSPAVASTKVESIPAGPGSLQVIEIGPMSVERAAHQATLLKSGLVLVTGGCAERGCELIHASAELFDPGSRSFQSIAPMTTPRAGHAAVILPDGRVLVTGGWTAQEATAGAEIYDQSTGLWAAAGDMIEARANPIALPLPDGRVLVMGGGSGGLADLASAEVFDPVTSTFTAVSPVGTNHYLVVHSLSS